MRFDQGIWILLMYLTSHGRFQHNTLCSKVFSTAFAESWVVSSLKHPSDSHTVLYMHVKSQLYILYFIQFFFILVTVTVCIIILRLRLLRPLSSSIDMRSTNWISSDCYLTGASPTLRVDWSRPAWMFCSKVSYLDSIEAMLFIRFLFPDREILQWHHLHTTLVSFPISPKMVLARLRHLKS